MSSSSSGFAGVRSAIWFIPVMCVIGGVILSFGTVAIDRATDFDLVPDWLTGGPDAAVAILTTIAASILSLATLVLTITMVVVQLAMGQFSPRIVQTFLQDRPSQLAIGLFVATFAHAMIAMREVQFEGDGQVPGLAIVVGYILVLTSIAMLVTYVAHIGSSLRVSALIELVGNDTRRLLDEQFPERVVSEQADPHVVEASWSGVLVEVDRERLVEIATASDCVVHVVPAVGEFVAAGEPMVRIEGDPHRFDADGARDALTFSLERTLAQDPAYGFRMLVDMAERSLSDSPFQDPTTAVQAIDRLYDGLRQLAVRAIPDGRHYDESGQLRVVIPVMQWDAFVRLAFDEVRLAGAESPQITRRLVAALQDLKQVAPPDRHGALDEQLELLETAVRDGSRSDRDKRMALEADRQGIGIAVTDADD